MKYLILTALLFVEVLGGNPFGALVRFKENLSLKCVTANDMVCPRSDITFWLYTKSTQVNPTKLDINTVDKAPWVDGPLKILIHGYSVDRDTAINAVLRPAYFSVGDYNIITVDWSVLCRQGCYMQAVQNIPTVAKCVADFFNAATKAHKFTDIHLLGHSMGAHVAAWASTHIENLPRLTKFDVAHPFLTESSKKGNAAFIDVYHTNCGLKGQQQASGDVDVYFNNNVFQPGCKCDTSCSHLRAVQYFAESIGDTMKVFPCGGWDNYVNNKCQVPKAEDLVVVGEGANIKARGVFMAFTSADPPFLLKDDVYTNEASFNGFKKTLAGECTIAYDYSKFMKDWF